MAVANSQYRIAVTDDGGGAWYGFNQHGDFILNNDKRKANGRALVPAGGNVLVINWAGDFAGGVSVASAMTVSDTLTARKNLVVEGTLIVKDLTVTNLKVSNLTVTGSLNLSGLKAPPSGVSTDRLLIDPKTGTVYMAD